MFVKLAQLSHCMYAPIMMSQLSELLEGHNTHNVHFETALQDTLGELCYKALPTANYTKPQSSILNRGVIQ